MDSITRAIALADEWLELKRYSDYRSALGSYFVDAKPHQLIAMWDTGKNEEGRELSPFEVEALVEAWCTTFGDLPPDDCGGPQDSVLYKQASLSDDVLLDTNEVVRLTGVSLPTLTRMVIGGRFPKPRRIGPRRIGWPARNVKGWLAELDRRPANIRM